MKRRTVKYTSDKGEVFGALQRVKDPWPKPKDLPSLDELAGEIGSQTKVTLAVDDDALAFFKREARRRNTSYQRMIRNLIRSYVRGHAAGRKD